MAKIAPQAPGYMRLFLLETYETTVSKIILRSATRFNLKCLFTVQSSFILQHF